MTNESIKTYSYRITQATRSQLIVIMYDMAIEYLEDGITCQQQEDDTAFCTNLRHAKRVIDELSGALDMKFQLSHELLRLYLYMGRVIVKALSRKEADEIQSVIGMLKKLRESFYEVSKTDQSGPLMNNVQQVYAGFTYSNAGNSNEFASDPTGNRGFQV